MNHKKIIGMSLKLAIKVLAYNGPVFTKKRIKLDNPEKLFDAVKIKIEERYL